MTTQFEELEQYRGRNRVILVFASSRTSRVYLEQKRLFEAVGNGLCERDLLVFYLFSDGSADTETLIERFNISHRVFTLVLIGKDGGEKERFLEPVQPAALFDIIDHMPMRRCEMEAEG